MEGIAKTNKKAAGVALRTVDRPTTPLQNVLLAMCGLAFFYVVCLSSASTVKAAGMLAAVALLSAVFLCFGTLRERIKLPLLALSAYVLMDGASTLYASAGKFALYEFLKVLIAFCLALILLAMAPEGGIRTGMWIAGVLEIFSALAGLVSIDLLSTRILSGFIQRALALFTNDYQALGGVEEGVRMTSIFTNPNVFAGVTGIGVLLSLGLCLSSEGAPERRVHTELLYLNALSFVLAFSMGASGSIVAAFAVILLLERKERRAELLTLMLETLALVMVSVALISITSFGAWNGVQPVPIANAILGAMALALLDERMGRRLSERISHFSRRTLALLGLGVFAALAVFAVLAWNLTVGASLNVGENLRRSAYPGAGSYTLSVSADGAVDVSIESQNRQETMMHTETTLYIGAAEGAAFTVPEGSLVVYFNFTAPEGADIASAFYAGEGDSGTIPLHYRLLPGFMANRLQGLRANENAIQRLVFFHDGMKLFRQSPVIGLGMGAYENGIKSVQSFYYETKYAHNHYIQALVDTGVIGLILFLALLGVSAFAVWRGRAAHPLAPALGAALAFMAIHAATEVVFSTYCYIPMAFGVFVLINQCCGEAIPRPRFGVTARTVSMLGISACVLAYGVLLAGNIYARNIVTQDTTLERLADATTLDRFEWADYALSYVLFCEGDVEEATRRQADAYAVRLAQQDSNAIPISLAEYYFVTGRPDEGFAMVEKYVDFVASDVNAWRQAFALLQRFERDDKAYAASVRRLEEKLESWNVSNMGDIALDAETQAFIGRYI